MRFRGRFLSKRTNDEKKEKDTAQVQSESGACFVLLNDTSHDSTLSQAYHSLTTTKGAHCGSGASAEHLTALGFLEGIPLMYQQLESLDDTDASNGNALISQESLCKQDSPDIWNVIESVNKGESTRFGILLVACTLENAALWTKVQTQAKWKDFMNLNKGRLYIYLEHESELTLDSSSHGPKQGFLIHLHPQQKYGSATVSNGYGYILYPNGDTYEGSLQHSKMNGKGIYRGATEIFDTLHANHMLEETQSTYDGEWRHGRRHGMGTLTCICIVREEEEAVDTTSSSGEVDSSREMDTSGEWDSGSDSRDKKGSRRTVVFQYEGEWKNGIMHGKGKYIRDSHTLYDGEWKHGVREGHGIQSFITTSGTESEYVIERGGRYEGLFVNNQRHGKGVQSWVNGSTYQGEFVCGKRHGWGKFQWPDGDSYEGMFEYDYKHGRGAYTYLSGNSYEGEWNRDVMMGKGLYIYDDGNRTLQFIWSEHGELERINVGSTSASIRKQMMAANGLQDDKSSENEVPVDHDLNKEKNTMLFKDQRTSNRYGMSISSYPSQEGNIFERSQPQTRKLSIKTLNLLGIELKGIDLSKYKDNEVINQEKSGASNALGEDASPTQYERSLLQIQTSLSQSQEQAEGDNEIRDDESALSDDKKQDKTRRQIASNISQIQHREGKNDEGTSHKNGVPAPHFQMTSSAYKKELHEDICMSQPEKQEPIKNIKTKGLELKEVRTNSISTPPSTSPSSQSVSIPSVATTTSPSNTTVASYPSFLDGRSFQSDLNSSDSSPRERRPIVTIMWPNGHIYKGQCHRGLRHGHGVSSHPNGNTYEGDYNSDRPHGKGILNYANKSVYKGEWTKGERTGQGIFSWSSGSVYEGEWKKGAMEGRGTYYFADGRKYRGEWLGNQKHGKGVYWWPSGNRYEGGWKQGKMHGKGVKTFRSGKVQDGIWEDNTFIG